MDGTIREEIGAIPLSVSGVDGQVPVQGGNAVSAPGVSLLSMARDLLMVETGPGEIVPDYTAHPLNPACSPGLGQLLRGVTGFMLHFNLGTLRKAVVDIVLGFIRWRGEKDAGNAGGNKSAVGG